jgi:mannose/fructose/N-acetylgalactosamine-specific phosphotransferase system component IIC
MRLFYCFILSVLAIVGGFVLALTHTSETLAASMIGAGLAWLGLEARALHKRNQRVEAEKQEIAEDLEATTTTLRKLRRAQD